MSDTNTNPYRPGAGHSPPYLAGREEEVKKFAGFLEQDDITTNVILTGLRGVGKTVLMDDRFKSQAQEKGWVWVGSDFSESSFLNEQNLCTRLLTDLSVFSSSLSLSSTTTGRLGFDTGAPTEHALTFDFLATYLLAQPGLMVDKLKASLDLVWQTANKRGIRGIVFAYDEAQVVADQKDKNEYPLALLLETFQSLQRKGMRYLLLLTGLPTLFPKLVESRTYAERMFSVQEIGRLSPMASRDAIRIPLQDYSWQFSDSAVETIVRVSDGYPYFIQFICREAFDYTIVNPDSPSIPIEPIVRKLDSNFFAGRWETLTDRQRDLLYCIAQLPHADEEFTIGEIVEASKSNPRGVKPFSPNDVSQILPRLIERGLVFKNRYSKYSFAVPLFSRFIMRRFTLTQKALFD
ncbi:MAG: ATP-binding protein [Planctomycetia bacterium]|nr:ATP-binding protein [Planctomycetia bacterium]